jgi:putative restriction endonuclease
MHWLFDRGLLSVDDDFAILTATGRVPDTIERLLAPDRRLMAPAAPGLAPASAFLKYHRETVFKG